MRPLLRLAVLVGAIGVGFVLFSGRPREVVLVYDVRALPAARSLEVEIRRGAEVVRRGELRVEGGEVRHPVRLAPGSYDLTWTARGAGGATRGERPLEVEDEGTIVLALAP